jgi:hypothetical protein
MVDDDDTCVCAAHGVQPATFVCGHIVALPRGQTVGFVSGASESEADLRDAWCDSCHEYLVSHGGEWTDDGAGVPGGIQIICAECYRAREADARRLGRRTIY